MKKQPDKFTINWKDQWRVVGEGPYSLLVKLLSSGSVLPTQLNLIIKMTSSTVGVNLLRWNSPDVIPPPDYKTAFLLPSSLGYKLPNFWKHIASDKFFRYCPACLDFGFQPSFAQIDGIINCPIHAEPLLSACFHCGHPTQHYRLNGNRKQPSFHCSNCFKTLSRSPGAAINMQNWKSPGDTQSIQQYEDWMKSIKDSKTFIISNPLHWSPTACETKSLESRSALFNVLLHFFPNPHITPNPLPVDFFGSYQVEDQTTFSHVGRHEYFDFCMSTLPITAFDTPNNMLNISNAYFFPIYREIPLEQQAAVIFRHIFEKNPTRHFKMENITMKPYPFLLDFEDLLFEKQVLGTQIVRQGLLRAIWCIALKIAHRLQSTISLNTARYGVYPNFDEFAVKRILSDDKSASLASLVSKYIGVVETITLMDETPRHQVSFFVA